MMLFLTSLESIVPIIALIVLGYFLQVKGWFHNDFGNDLSKLIMNVAMPVSIFVSVLKYLTLEKLMSLSGGLIYTFVAFALGYIVAFLSVKVLKVAPGRRGTVINTFVNANTIFIGLPLNIALFGDNALAYFLIYYITNTISTWTLGVFLMTSDSKDGKKKQGSKFNWKKLLPAPLLGFIVSVVFLVINIPLPSYVSNTLSYVGGLTTPLSLIYIGIVLAKAGIKTIHFDKDSILALVGRFIVSPLLMFLVLKLMDPQMATAEYQTFMIQSVTPALAVLPILANQGDGDVEFSTNIVTLSTILFVIVIPIIQTLIG
ncbi:AEC family transporter [uncultured Granulicatella sp.]|uniref:AEC family transporter n=1 Tax=uncultured Granulicatella sp. TaxID=316089 RepID=UPI00260E4115|nr:AEC family transporter [uncultured Granulicatella sp.]